MTQEKKIYTREEFESMRLKMAQDMAENMRLQADALNVLVEADRYNWIHQSTWFGEPALQLPQDMFAIQEIIYKTRPDFVIEVGVAWGGSVLFNATICEALGHGHVIGIDIFMPNDLIERLGKKGAVSERITLLEGSSVSPEIRDRVCDLIGENRHTLVILDSYHSHEHVLEELTTYSPFVGKNCYLVCGDTIIEKLPEQPHRPREWGKGNNPATALDVFLNSQDRFVIDSYFDNKLLLSCNPKGYLRAVRNPE
jgi:cephalosporin hydroxylase